MDETPETAPEAIAIEPPPLPALSAPERRPWGFWASLGWSVLAFLGGGILGEIAIVPLGLGGDFMNGDSLIVSGSISAAVTILLLCGVVRLRLGWSVKDYVAVFPVRVRTVIGWTVLLVAWSLSFDVFQMLRGEPVVPDVMLHTYHTATVKSLLLVFVVLLGPIMEEFAIRGFLFRGWAQSRIGPWGAVILTSILFGSLHAQYDYVGMAFTGTIGFILAVARYKTGSIVPGIVMHGAVNLVASIETVWVAAHTNIVTQV